MKAGRPSISSEHGFTIVEMAIVMVIVGILVSLGITMVGSLAKTAKVNETQGTIEAGLESLIGFAATNKRLPINANFAAAVKKANDAWGNPLYYIVDASLAPAAPYTAPDYICNRRSTGLTVRNCLTDNCAAAAGTDYVDIPNTAFLVMSGGENFNLQTAAAAGRCVFAAVFALAAFAGVVAPAAVPDERVDADVEPVSTLERTPAAATDASADLNANDLDAAVKIIAGTARSMGVEVAE